jgi:CHASE3 domain sensor protein
VTDPTEAETEKRAYRWPRRYVFAATLVIVILVIVLVFAV